MTQPKSVPSLLSTSWSTNEDEIHHDSGQPELHHRRLAWTILDPIGFVLSDQKDNNFNSSIVSEKISQPIFYWNEIGIVGFRTILDSQAHFVRRLMWFVILLTCFSLMLVQTHDRLNYYLDRPVSTTVRFIRNDSLIFPSITLCPYRDTLKRDAKHLDSAKLKLLYQKHFPDEHFNETVEAMYKLANFYDVQTLWSFSGVDLEDEISICLHARVNCTLYGKMKKIFTVLGSCLHYDAPSVTISGNFYGLNIKLCAKDNETQRIDKFYMMISDHYSSHDIRSLTHGFYLEQGWTKEVAVSLKHFQAENKQQAPCSPDQSRTVSRCISECFHRVLANKTGCRMPYMNSVDMRNVPYCNSSELLRQTEDMQTELLWEGRGWHPANCHCGNNTTCSQYIYETSCDTFARHDNCAQYKIYFTDMTYEDTREEFAYDVISLLCDIGGTIGLLLGASVLTVIQFLDAMSRQLTRWMTKGSHVMKRPKSSDIVTSFLRQQDLQH